MIPEAAPNETHAAEAAKQSYVSLSVRRAPAEARR